MTVAKSLPYLSTRGDDATIGRSAMAEPLLPEGIAHSIVAGGV
ncbi:hypothetical protein [Nocardia sp. NPDC050710]